MVGIFTDPATYDDPLTFDPDRFIRSPIGIGKNVDPASVSNLKDFIYGFGKRACPGIVLAKNSLVSTSSKGRSMPGN